MNQALKPSRKVHLHAGQARSEVNLFSHLEISKLTLRSASKLNLACLDFVDPRGLLTQKEKKTF